MKTLLYIITILFLAGCTFTPSYYHPEFEPQSSRDLEEWESLNGERVDNFFLDYHFGMSKDEYMETTRLLIFHGRLKGTVLSPIFTFYLNDTPHEFKMSFPDFLNDGLTRISMRGEQKESFEDYQQLYKKKYGPANVTYIGAINPDEYFKIYRGNMLIEVNELQTGIRITYEDYAKSDEALQQWIEEYSQAKQEREEREARQKERQSQQAINDI